MSSLQREFADYEAHHMTPGNRWTHAFGIPIIALSLLGLGQAVRFPEFAGVRLDLGGVLALLMCVVFAARHLGLGLGIALLFVPLYLAGGRIPTIGLWILLAVGLALQYLGHLWFEKNQPAFHKNAVHMIVGPMWMAALLFRLIGFPVAAARPPE